MSNEMDYDFIGRIGASHYGSDGMLCKFDRSGNLLVWFCDAGSWGDYPESHEVMLCDNIKPIPPGPEVKEPEYIKKEFDEQWEAARFQCDEGGLYFGDEATGFKKVTYQHQAAHLVDSLYTRKEIKRDWRDSVVFDGVYKCELTKNLIIDESFNKAGAIKLAKSILKAAGENAGKEHVINEMASDLGYFCPVDINARRQLAEKFYNKFSL